jgi:hypothetical protein
VCVCVIRTVRDWRPTRLGGGKGGRPALKSKKDLAAEEAAKSGGGGGLAPTLSTTYGPGSRDQPRRADSRERGGDRGGG